MMTLAQITQTFGNESKWSNYTRARRYAVGRNGHQQGRRGTAGSKMHLLLVDTIIAEHGEHRPGTLKVGDVASIVGTCAGNGQYTGVVAASLDTDAVTCEKCVKYLAVLERLATERQEIDAKIDAALWSMMPDTEWVKRFTDVTAWEVVTKVIPATKKNRYVIDAAIERLEKRVARFVSMERQS